MTTQIRDKFRGAGIWSGTTMGRMPEGVHARIERTRTPTQPALGYAFHGFDIFDSTACYGGFTAEWELRESSLYLLDVAGYYRILGERPVFADWVSGLLLVDHGARVDDDKGFLEPIHEHCSALQFSGGLLQSRSDWTYDPTLASLPWIQLANFHQSLPKS